MQCPFCSEPLSDKPIYIRDHCTTESFRMARCDSCQSRILLDIPKDLKDYYYDLHGHAMSRRSSSLIATLREQLLKSDLSFILNHREQDQRVLDFGCGDGACSDVMTRHGVSVIGADIYDPKCWNLESALYRKISSLDDVFEIERLCLDERITDVLMRHVLEHLPNPRGLLSVLYRARVQRISIIVPNANSLVSKLFGANWYYWDPPRHVSHFSTLGLQSLMESVGYRCLKFDLYGLDEIVCSLYRLLSIAAQTSHTRQFINIKWLAPRSILSALSSVVSYPFFNSVIRAHFVRRD
jgi:hypothetical protein